MAARHILVPVAFEAVYHADLLHVINPDGDVGLVTLWSPFRTVRRKLEELSPALLDPASSRIAVVANLYGDGMQAMFCNLLFNPQVRHLVGVGEDLGLSTCDEIEAFLEHGLEDDVMLGTPVKRVRGTARVFPDVAGFDDARLRAALSFRHFGKLSRPGLGEELPAYLDELPRASNGAPAERVRVEIPEADPEVALARRPAAVGAHQVVRSRPLDCWEELVVRAMRFGHPVALRKGRRLELLNAKAVITAPEPEPRDALAAFGFDLDRFEEYGRRILTPELPEGISYTYGNRLRAHFGADGLATAIDLLRADPETRGAYVSLWDNAVDLTADAGSKPCLATLFFRRSEGRVTLTATYRSHNLLGAWLENVYGLMAIQRYVGERAGVEAGAITVISHSLGIDPRSPRFAMARSIEANWERDDDFNRAAGKYSLREDPNGYFVVSADRERGLIVAEHRFGGILVKRYEAERATAIEQQVSADMAVSLVSHAMWLGRELSAKERLLRG